MNTELANAYILFPILPRIVPFILIALESNIETHNFELFMVVLTKTRDHVFPDFQPAVFISNPIDSLHAIFSLIWTNEVLILYLSLYGNKHLN